MDGDSKEHVLGDQLTPEEKHKEDPGGGRMLVDSSLVLYLELALASNRVQLLS